MDVAVYETETSRSMRSHPLQGIIHSRLKLRTRVWCIGAYLKHVRELNLSGTATRRLFVRSEFSADSMDSFNVSL